MSDAASLAAIYNHYVMTSTITFEEEVVPREEMARRIEEVRGKGLPWCLAEVEMDVVGYAYARPWKTRSAYRFSVEVTVYVARGQAGQGVGTTLYTGLLRTLRELGFHAVMAGIALPNAASVAFHQRFGFEKVAHFSEVGFKRGMWVDVGYWQLMLSRVGSGAE